MMWALRQIDQSWNPSSATQTVVPWVSHLSDSRISAITVTFNIVQENLINMIRQEKEIRIKGMR